MAGPALDQRKVARDRAPELHAPGRGLRLHRRPPVFEQTGDLDGPHAVAGSPGYVGAIELAGEFAE